MFAGAAREAVFSHPKVVERIKNDFIPVSLKAGNVARPPDGPEGDLYRQLRRTRAADQGIGVMNSAGKVLGWSLMFDDDAAVLGFLDHAVKRFQQFPDGSKPVATERFRRFPSDPMPEVADDGTTIAIPDSHIVGELCPGSIREDESALLARVVGRVVDEKGRPASDVRTQENYVEDKFSIPLTLQRELAAAAADGPDLFRLPPRLAHLIAANAYLGQLDVNPLGGDRIRAQTTRSDLNLWAKRSPDNPMELVVGGTTSVAGKNDTSHPRSNGQQWENAVNLQWQGYITLADEGRFKSLIMAATGDERFFWLGPGGGRRQQGASAVATLLGGSHVDFHRPVRFGFTTESR